MNRRDPPAPPCSRERQRADSVVSQGHLPRLAPEYYRGRTFVHWTLTIEDRATGWLSPTFHHGWQLGLLHACARFGLLCPAYVLMPDHIHCILLGRGDRSDQRLAIAFLRRTLRPALAPAEWQRQAFDHVLREKERLRDAFADLAKYVLQNPVRAGLADRPIDYPFLGCCLPGYPEMDVRAPDFWERFWRIHNFLLET